MNKKFTIICLIITLLLVPVCLFADSFDIYNETQLVAAMNNLYTVSGYNWIKWNIKSSFDLTCSLEIENTKGDTMDLIIEGNNKTITAHSFNELNSVLLVCSRSKTGNSLRVEIRNLTIVVEDGFRNGITMIRGIYDGYKLGTMPSLTLKNVTIVSKHEKPFKTTEGVKKNSTLIQCNNSSLTLTGNCSLITDAFCWAAIDVDNAKGYSRIILDDASNTTIVDNRNEYLRASEPLIKFTISNSDNGPVFEYNKTDDKASKINGIAFDTSLKKITGTTNDGKSYYGYIFPDQHYHGNWSYAISGRSIVATCGVDGCTLPDSKAWVTLSNPGELQLHLDIDPSEATEKVIWDTNNPAVATVDQNGFVRAVSAGEVEISVHSIEGSGLSDSIEITVK